MFEPLNAKAAAPKSQDTVEPGTQTSSQSTEPAFPTLTMVPSPGQAVQRMFESETDLSPSEMHAYAQQGVSGLGQPLPHLDYLKTVFTGQKLDNIQAYTSPTAQAACHRLGAKAFTLGDKIAFRTTNPDKHTVTHETTHVLQQRAGVDLKDAVGSEGDSYEQQAERVANTGSYSSEIGTGTKHAALQLSSDEDSSDASDKPKTTTASKKRKKGSSKPADKPKTTKPAKTENQATPSSSTSKPSNKKRKKGENDSESANSTTVKPKKLKTDSSTSRVKIKAKKTKGTGKKTLPNDAFDSEEEEPTQSKKNKVSTKRKAEKLKDESGYDSESEAAKSRQKKKQKKAKKAAELDSELADDESEGDTKPSLTKKLKPRASRKQLTDTKTSIPKKSVPMDGSLFYYDKTKMKYMVKPGNTVSYEEFVNGYYQSLAIRQNHLSLIEGRGQSGYIRSSDNAYKKYGSTPTNPSFRDPHAIGHAAGNLKSAPMDAMKQGFALPPAAQAESLAKATTQVDKTDKDYMQAIGADIAGEGYIKAIKARDPKAELNKEFEGIDDPNWYAEHESGYHVKPNFKFSSIKLGTEVQNAPLQKPSHINEQLLARFAICQEIAGELEGKTKHVFLAAEREYPCLGVGVTIPDNFNSDEKAGFDDEVELWTLFCMYVFLGICKAGELKKGFEVLARSSFGHLETTVADCWQTFRINVGLIGPTEIALLIDYLQSLDKYLVEAFGEKTKEKNGLHTSDGAKDLESELFSTEKTKAKNEHGIYFVNKNDQKRLMFLIKRVADAIQNKKDKDLLRTLASDKTLLMKDKLPAQGAVSSKPISKELQALLEQHYGVKFSTPPTYQNYAELLREYIGGSIFNQEVAGQVHGEDSYGSDSDADDEVAIKGQAIKQPVFGKKIVLPWGMRAIVCAMEAAYKFAGVYTGEKPMVDTMYYESKDIKHNWLRNDKTSKKYKLGLKDLNYFNNRHSLKNAVAKPVALNERFQIWDVTSATEKSMATLLQTELLESQDLDFILLVSSGTKNDYAGLDVGGHGVIRIFAKKEILRNEIYDYITQYARTKTPWLNNKLRRGFKKRFGVAQNRGILNYLTGKKMPLTAKPTSKTGKAKQASKQSASSSSSQPTTALPSDLDDLFNNLLLLQTAEDRKKFYQTTIKKNPKAQGMLEFFKTVIEASEDLTLPKGMNDSEIMINTCWAFRFFKNLQHNVQMRDYYIKSIDQTLALDPADHGERMEFLRRLKAHIEGNASGNLASRIRWFVKAFFPLHFKNPKAEIGQQQGIEDVELGIQRLIDEKNTAGNKRVIAKNFKYTEHLSFKAADVTDSPSVYNTSASDSSIRIAKKGALQENEVPFLRTNLKGNHLAIASESELSDELIAGHNAHSVGKEREFEFLVDSVSGVPLVPYFTIAYGWQAKAPVFEIEAGKVGIWIKNNLNNRQYFFALNAVDVHTGGMHGGHWFGANLTTNGWIMTDFEREVAISDIAAWITERTTQNTDMYFRFVPTDINKA